jgi:hypothetical protein
METKLAKKNHFHAEISGKSGILKEKREDLNERNT